MRLETWNTFPQQIVQKINGLLDEALPNSSKAFQIYKMCQSEGLWDRSFSEFSFLLEGFYQTPRYDRKKSQMDQFLNRPIDFSFYETVHLTFRTAQIADTEIRDIAVWAHNMLRLSSVKASPATSVEALNKTIFEITHPSFDGKDHDIDFEDFCEAWTKSVGALYGEQFKTEHQSVLSELRTLDRALRNRAEQLPSPVVLDRIYLTQTEIDWVERSLEAMQTWKEIPCYPLSKGPTKIPLIDLLKWLRLWEVTKSVQAPALQDKLEKLRNYILGECERLLATCRR